MKGFSTKAILSPDFQMPNNYDDLLKVYRTIAKTADQRLVRLESYAHDPNYENVKKWAYARAMHDIKAWSGPDATRFNTAAPETKRAIIAKINDIKQFLESKTSTKEGINESYKNRVDTINDKFGTNFTWRDVGTFFESELYAKMDSKYTSNVIVQAVAEVQKHQKEIIDAMQGMKDKLEQNAAIRGVAIKVDDPMVQDAVNFMLKKQAAKVRKLLT